VGTLSHREKLTRLQRCMRTLLRIDASSQTTRSHSRALADHLEARWRAVYPGGRILRRNPASLPHLDEATIAVFYAGGATPTHDVPAGIVLSNALIAELREADDILVSSALYNFGMPSALKAWIDHIVRFGYTIGPGAHGTVGLLSGKHAFIVTARGGNTPDYQSPVLKAVFDFIGIREQYWISLNGTRLPDGQLEERIRAAKAAIDNLPLVCP